MTTFYLKYRPKNLDELDLTSVSESLKKIMSSENIPHAFLFAGPKGTGKTSAARILAKIINCLAKPDPALQDGGIPCNKCQQCTSITNGSNLDVAELDAASHRGIDDIRTLRDAVKLAPASGKKKIYIIDEAHMLTTEASNALLKTLEEPPAHVVFILATTNPEKLIDTIRSRTTFIPFKKATVAEIVRSLKRVVVGEKLKISDEALSVIADFADGAFRDAIKVLEQSISSGVALTKEALEESLLSKKLFDIDGFIKLLIKRDKEKLLTQIETFTQNGVSAEIFLTALISQLHTELLGKSGIGTESFKELSEPDLIRLIDLFTESSNNISNSPIEVLPLELAVVKFCGGNGSAKYDDRDGKSENEDRSRKMEAGEEKTKVQTSDISSLTSSINDDVWKSILTSVRPINASIEALLRAAKPIAYDGKTLTLGVYYKFHKERLEDSTHRRVLEDVITKILNGPTKIICTLTEPPAKKVVEEAEVKPVLTEGEDRDIIKVAEEIFGN
ncbi:MAG: DNA polymerase III subunit gamma/tau [bacterium]|nr:DNA polymerase III subunit gamma/tau [bacterium]